MRDVGAIVELLTFLYLLALLCRLVVDWVQVFARAWTPRGPVLVILESVYSVTDPPINFVRRLVPPLRLGGISLDLGFFIVLIALFIIRALNQQLLLR